MPDWAPNSSYSFRTGCSLPRGFSLSLQEVLFLESIPSSSTITEALLLRVAAYNRRLSAVLADGRNGDILRALDLEFQHLGPNIGFENSEAVCTATRTFHSAHYLASSPAKCLIIIYFSNSIEKSTSHWLMCISLFTNKAENFSNRILESLGFFSWGFYYLWHLLFYLFKA